MGGCLHHFYCPALSGQVKSMCVAAKGRLQRRAATLLLLCVGFFLVFFFVFMQQKFHFHCVIVFFRLACNAQIGETLLRFISTNSSISPENTNNQSNWRNAFIVTGQFRLLFQFGRLVESYKKKLR